MDSRAQDLRNVSKRRSFPNSTSTPTATAHSSPIAYAGTSTTHSRSSTPQLPAQAQAQPPLNSLLHSHIHLPPPLYSKLTTKAHSAVAFDGKPSMTPQPQSQQASSVYTFTPSGPGPFHVHGSPVASSSQLRGVSSPPSPSQLDQGHVHIQSDDDEDIVWASSAPTSRGRFHNFVPNERLKLISTDPMKRGAGETETELDEPPRHLPTSRKPPSRASTTPLAPIMILFQIFRLLSVVPAIAGMLYHVYAFYTSSRLSAHSLVDHLICILWALLTAHQCLCLTTGLLLRWKAYYPPLPTLIRLLALQAICWPATQFTLVLFNHAKRPVVCWAVIGSTTCISRAVQIWVTSNLWGRGDVGGRLFGADRDRDRAAKKSKSRGVGINKRMSWLGGVGGGEGWGEEGRKWGPRRWDWTEVGMKCALPAGVVYFVMAWGMVLRTEFEGC